MENRILKSIEGTPVKSWYTLHSPEQNREVNAHLSSVEWMDGIFLSVISHDCKKHIDFSMNIHSEIYIYLNDNEKNKPIRTKMITPNRPSLPGMILRNGKELPASTPQTESKNSLENSFASMSVQSRYATRNKAHQRF